MINKPTYSMSAVGNCPRVLAAGRLGYEPLPLLPWNEARLNHYSALESVAAQQIIDLGYRVETGALCQVCLERYKNERHGIHVEIDTPLLLLVGHLDRRLIISSNSTSDFIGDNTPPITQYEIKLPVEIKSLGKSSWMKFQKEQFNGFPGYAGQECCYLWAEGQPGIYWVMERDSGKSLRYIVNDFNNEINLDGFDRITLPITFDQVVDRLNGIEVHVQEGTLPDGEEHEFCHTCRLRYLCVRQVETKLQAVDIPYLVKAAKEYKHALELEKTAKEMKDNAKDTLLLHSKQDGIDKYSVSGLSVSYRGQTTKEYLDSNSLKKENPDIYQKYVRYSEPYDDYSIRRLKE